jgi:hypothetical protein
MRELMLEAFLVPCDEYEDHLTERILLVHPRQQRSERLTLPRGLGPVCHQRSESVLPFQDPSGSGPACHPRIAERGFQRWAVLGSNQ